MAETIECPVLWFQVFKVLFVSFLNCISKLLKWQWENRQGQTSMTNDGFVGGETGNVKQLF